MIKTELTNRRSVLKAGLGAMAAVATGCRVRSRRELGFERPLSRMPFVAPRIGMDRVVGVVVGLRPFRPSGFVVRRDNLDGKAVIHNYGHGGGGISLSWGSSALAVRESAELPVGKAAVLGAGIMGLTTARLLQDRGWEVTIYTRDMPRHTTSNVGGGQWGPTSVYDEHRVTAGFLEQFRQAARIAHHAFQNLVGAGYGVRFLENYFLGWRPVRIRGYQREIADLFASAADLEPGEHPFPTPYVHRSVTMMIEPAVFLRRVRDDFLLAGGRFDIRHFNRLDDVLALDESTIFNCTGLGAARLFGDSELMPIKGQLVFLLPDSAVDYATIGGGTRGLTYMFPRRGELVLGGSYQRGDWSMNPQPEVTERIILDHQELFASM